MASYIGQNDVCGPVGVRSLLTVAGNIKLARIVSPSPVI